MASRTTSLELNLSGFYSHLNATTSTTTTCIGARNEFDNNLPTSFTVAEQHADLGRSGPTNNAGGRRRSTASSSTTSSRPGASAYTYVHQPRRQVQADRPADASRARSATPKVRATPTERPRSKSTRRPGFPTRPPATAGRSRRPTSTRKARPASPTTGPGTKCSPSKDKEIYGQVDGEYDIDDGIFKDVAFGFHRSDHTRQVDGWDRGCTLGANGACWTSPTMPFSATNPVPYPSGFNAGALGIPGLLIPIAGNPSTIGQHPQQHQRRRARPDLVDRHAAELLLARLASRCRRPTMRATSWPMSAATAGAATSASASSTPTRTRTSTLPDAAGPRSGR